MQKSLIQLLGFAMALAMSTTVFAVGMGGISVGSGLGQQLKANIELVAVTKSEKASLVARLASPEAYKEAGLEYPYGNKFRFQIESRVNGDPYLKVSTDQPVNDPFVIMLVELTWSSGKLLREYTFLLDPPGYVAEQPAQAPVQAVAPVIQAVPVEIPPPPAELAAPEEQPAQVTAIAPVEQTSSSETTAASEVQAASAVQEVPVEQAVPVEQEQAAPVEQAAPEEQLAVAELNEWVTVKRGDTLRELADQYKLADISLDRMLVALYRVNADQFVGKNMNRIKAGKILRLPNQGEVEAVSQSEAIKDIRAQTADWNAYRQKLASAAETGRQPQAAQQVATGKISSSVADDAPVVKETAKEVLKLSKGIAPGDSVATGTSGKPVSPQDAKNAAQEDAIAKSKALKEVQERTAMLDKSIKDIQHLAQLKSEAAALAQSSKTAALPVVAASAVAAASTEKPKPKPQPKVVEPEPLMDQIMAVVNEEPLYLAGGALLLLGLGGLGFMLAKRKKIALNENVEKPEVEEDKGDSANVGDTTAGHLTAPVVPSPDTGDFTGVGASKEVAHQADNIDPIGEADLFLNFGRDAQAEEILKEALQNTPSDHRIHLKLLGIYVNRVDVSSFSAIAKQLRDSGDADAWQQAVAMGRKLEPNNPLYGGSGGVEESSSATIQTTAFNAHKLSAPANAPAAQATTLDFDIDMGSGAAKNEAPSPEQDFLGDAGQNAVMSFDILSAGEAPQMDFNVAEEQDKSGKTEAALPDTGDMIFDVSDYAPKAIEQPKVGKPAEADDGGMEFTIDLQGGSFTKQAVHDVSPVAAGLTDINLNFDDVAVPAEPTSASKGEQWQEVATKLDLAKAYQEMGDASGAREILDEVMREGDAEQREAAQTLLNQLD